MTELPLIGQPHRHFAPADLRQVQQQLCEIELRVNAVPAAGSGRLLLSNPAILMARSFSCSGTIVICGDTGATFDLGLSFGDTLDFPGITIVWCQLSQPPCYGSPEYTGGTASSYKWTTSAPAIVSMPGSSTSYSVSLYGAAVGTSQINETAYDGYGCSTGGGGPANVVSATISQRTTGQVSSDDAALSNYQTAEGTTNLGPIIGNGTSTGCFVGLETIGTVLPSTYTGNVILHRTIASDATYTNSTSTGGAPPGTDDTSLPALRSDNPQSSSPPGKVYDLDAPGVTNLSVDGNTYRLRTNFYAYAALPDGTQISPNYNFYVRVSCTKTASGYQFVNGISGDNQAGPGTTKTTWNLQ